MSEYEALAIMQQKTKGLPSDIRELYIAVMKHVYAGLGTITQIGGISIIEGLSDDYDYLLAVKIKGEKPELHIKQQKKGSAIC